MIGYAGTTHQSLDPVGDAVAKVAYFGNLEPLKSNHNNLSIDFQTSLVSSILTLTLILITSFLLLFFIV